MSSKVCGSCGIEKPVSEFYKAYVTVGGEQRYGTDCRECAKAKIRERMQDDEYREKSNRYYREWRRDNGLIKGRTKNVGDMRPCGKCGELKLLVEYTYDKGRDRYAGWCKECKRQQRKEWGERRSQHVAEYQKKYYASLPKKDKATRTVACGLKSCGREFEATGPQKYCSDECRISAAKERKPKVPKRIRQCRMCGKPEGTVTFAPKAGCLCVDCVRVYRAEKHQQHKAYYKQKNRERKIRRKNAEGSHTEQQWEALKAKYNHMCLCCGATDVQLTRDHVLPLSKGGHDDIDNIQPLCHACNSSKSIKEIDFR